MLSKKTILALTIVVVIATAGGGYYFYKKGIFSNSEKIPLTPDKLLAYSFENKNPNLSPEVVQLFQQRLNETKEKLQKNPDDFDSWLYLGVLKKGISDYEGARDIFVYAGQIRPKSSIPFANLADLYGYFLNEPPKAEEAIKKAISNDPNDYNFYFSLADIYRYKFPDGEKLYEQTMMEAMQKFPDNPNIVARLASYYRETSQMQKAIEWYEKLIKIFPNNEAARRDLEELRKK